MERVQENSNLVLTCNVCPETSVNFTQMAFLALKNWTNTMNGVLKVQKVFFEKKKIDCFLKIKRSAMLFLPNVSHYHSEYFCLRFIAVSVCFPSNLCLSKEPLICKLEKD